MKTAKKEKKESFSVGNSVAWREGKRIEEYSEGPFRVSEVIPVPPLHCECGADEFYKSGQDPWPDEMIEHDDPCPKNIGNSVGHHQWVKVVDSEGSSVGESSLYSAEVGTPGATFSGAFFRKI
ncbi:MAG: hypothetical protein Q8Q95_02030 [bacterium]|nr:hypothetical protein [bacterium]